MPETTTTTAPAEAPGAPVPSPPKKRGPLDDYKRKYENWRLRRRRAKNAKGRRATSKRSTLVLVGLLILLFAAFAWSTNYAYTAETPGEEITFDELSALAAQERIETAEFRDEDNKLVGTFVAEPPEDETGAGGDAKNKEGKEGKANADKADRQNRNDRGGKNGNDEPTPREQREAELAEIAPAGEGTYWLDYPPSDAAFGVLSELVISSGARVSVDPQTSKTIVRSISTYLLPLLILAAAFGLLFTAGKGGGGAIGEVMTFGTLGAKKQKKGFTTPTTFGDVGGAQEAIAELREVVDYLSNPKKYEEIGAIPPKGVLLFGPPGCGKTLLAKAVAGEASVPFFSVAGAEFVESLVGVGAARVRDLFARVRAVAPAIVFIDELDAAGRKRGGGEGGGSDEREQTLNQLLVEMDGFEVSAGVVIIGATNRPDILDPALLRPGRFDRHITVDQPDHDARVEILKLHARGKPLASSVDLNYLAKRTPGFSGADLANVINEGALLTLREKKPEIEIAELEEAIQRVLHGPKRRGRVLSDDERLRAAYHESGHAVVAAALGHAEDIHRVTILARSKGVGATGIQREEVLLKTRNNLFAEVVIAMGGLAAEEVVLEEPSTGAEQDIEQATDVARDIVGRFGMSPQLGRARLLASDVDQFLGNDSGFAHLSEETHQEFDKEVRRLLSEGEDEAIKILEENRAALDALAKVVEEHETVEGTALYSMLKDVPVDLQRLSRVFGEGSNNGRAGTVARKTNV
ncbi:MAG: ATP-dependent zinc metalloprotease FtsH [Actinobacteria bacterium]|nr:ATP-dependent zinc metalloprotease FtsH [Actinomycetota bacterium]